MRVASSLLDDYIAGTTVGDHLEAWAVRGEQIAGPLLVTDWAFAWDAIRQRQGECKITIADPDGDLSPWGVGDMLGPGGSRLLLTWVPGEEAEAVGIPRVPMGKWRISEPIASESWLTYQTDTGLVRVSAGASVSLQLYEDPTYTAILDEIDAEALTPGTVLSNVRSLLSRICGVDAVFAPPDGPAPSSLVYGTGRMDAVTDLLDAIDADFRAAPDGSLQVVPMAGVGPVWTLSGGPEGVLIRTTRTLSDESLANYAISTNATDQLAPLVGRDYVRSGPLTFDGPFGRRPVRHNAVATTQEGVDADARTLLASRNEHGEVDIQVSCLAHPALQIHDRITVVAATRQGDTVLTGRVTAMSLTSASGTPSKRMALTVRVGAADLDVALWQARHRGTEMTAALGYPATGGYGDSYGDNYGG